MGVCFNKKKIEIVSKNQNPKEREKEKEIMNLNISIKKGEDLRSSRSHKKTEEKVRESEEKDKIEEIVKKKLEQDPILDRNEEGKKEMRENYNTERTKNNDTLEKLINSNLEEISDEEENIYKLNFIPNEPLFNLVYVNNLINYRDFYVTSNSEYSTDNDWIQILKKAKYQNKLLLAAKIMNIKERKWNKENILLSDIIKENRDNMDSYILAKYLNLRLKLNEHFNWLIWALSYYYYTVLFTETSGKEVFKGDEFGLPSVDSIEWINGFEWKGIFIRVQTHDQSNFLIQELKALNYLFFDYIQLIDTVKFKNNDDDNNKQNFLSNELIFPLISYSNICNLIIAGSVCINKYSYDINDNEKISMNRPSEKDPHFNLYTFNNKNLITNLNTVSENPFVRYQPKVNNLANKDNINLNNNNNVNNYLSYGPELGRSFSHENTTPPIKNKNYITNANAYKSGQYVKTNSKNNYHTVNVNTNPSNNELMTERDKKNNFSDTNNELSNIMNENNSYHSINVSHNINKDINLNFYSREDLQDSILLSKIEPKHLIKVIDDLNDYNNYITNIASNHNNYGTEVNNPRENLQPKFKFMIISASQLIPDLFDNQKNNSLIYIDEDEDKGVINFSINNFNKKFKFDLDIEKSSNRHQTMVEKLISNENWSKIYNHEGNFNSINFKIFYNSFIDNQFGISENISNTRNSNYNSYPTNKRVNDFFLKIHSKQVSSCIYNNKLFNNYSFSRQQNFPKQIKNNLEITGKSVVMYSLAYPIKIKYSLIKNKKYEEIYNENFTNNINFLNLIDKFAKNLDANLSIDNVKSLKNYFHRFGVNTSMEIFLLPKLKNPKIADLIKINILCKMIKEFFNFHEGVNFLLKINLVNANTCLSSLKSTIENLNIMNDGYFEFIKEKSIMNIQKMKIYYIIISILNSKNINQEFTNYFFENLNFIFFNKFLKWKLTDEVIGFNLFNNHSTTFSHSIENIYSQENLFNEFINTSRKRPFVFLNVLEYHLRIKIDAIAKFKASLAVEQFIFYFNNTLINDSEPIVESYIKSSELSYYLFSKCIYTSKTSTKYDIFKNKFTNLNNQTNAGNPPLDKKRGFKNAFAYVNSNVNNILSSKSSKETKPSQNMTNTLNQGKLIKEKSKLFYPPNSIKTKVNLLAHENSDSKNLIDTDKNNKRDSSIGKMNNNIKINSNNITKLNQNNNRYLDTRDRLVSNQTISQNKVKSDDEDSKYISMESKTESMIKPNDDEEDLLNQRTKIWDSLAVEMDLNFPAIMYKMYLKNDEKLSSKKNIYKFLRSNYSFNKIDTIKDWRSCMETLLNDIISIDGSESVIIKSYIFLFIHASYIENDIFKCKEIIYKIKELMKFFVSYKYDLLAIINLIEGLLIEKKNYIESEEYFSKCLIFALLYFGDPRGRGSFGKDFMLFPLWKIARQTCILENSLTNESFKEMFHCQDYLYKLQLDILSSSVSHTIDYKNSSNKFNNLYVENFTYCNFSSLKMKKVKSIIINDKSTSGKRHKRLNEKLSLSDIIFDEDINEDVSADIDFKNYFISDRNFEFIHKYKHFPFPSISDVKTSYQTYFSSENFIQYLFKNMLTIPETDNLYDDDYLNKLGINFYSVTSTIETNKSNSNLVSKDSFKSNIPKKDKSAIFSNYLYEYLMDKMSYKKTPPNSIVLSWGNNNHNETTHNNYDFLSLPRVCYKLKDEEIYKISCGWEHSVAITKEKKCFAWGNNESGQCGVGEAPIIYNPALVENIDNVIEVSCGNEHSLALLQNGEVFSWGKSEDGVLGYIEKDIEFIPKKIQLLNGVSSISSGSIHNIVLMNDGTIKSWGCSKGGQLGHSENYYMNLKNFAGYLTNPTDVETIKFGKIKKVSCGEAHSLALTTEGKVYGWGFTSNGQLGLGICEDSFEPGQGMAKCRILEPRLIKTDFNFISDIQCGKTFSTFITEKNEVLVCGVNDLNQLGIDYPTSIDHIYRKEDAYLSRCCDVVLPTPVECFLNMKVNKIACGESHCLALITDLSNTVLSLWSWGSNRFGQLGQGSQIKKSMPKPINYVLGYTNSEVEEIACGAYHSLCVLSNKYIDVKKDKCDMIINIYSNKWTFK